jgi:hypothetical protein
MTTNMDQIQLSTKPGKKKKVACLSFTQKNHRFFRHEKAGFKSDFPS